MSEQQSRWGRRRVVAGVAALGLAAGMASVIAPVGTASAATNTPRTVLTKGQTVAPGHVLSTGTFTAGNPGLNHSYQLVLQTNGNLVEYADYPAQGPKYVLWRSDTASLGAAKDLMLTSAGNLLVHAARGTWSSATIGNQATRLAIASDGNMTLYTAAGHAVWASRTGLCAKVPITNGHISTEISAACRQLGKPYTFGGGHGPTPGPTWGDDSPSVPSFDCSGLTRFAFYGATGHDVPGGQAGSTAASQWSNGMTGTKHQGSRSGMAVGDFEYFYNAAYTPALHHTAIYLGAGYLIEAPETGLDIRVKADTYSDFHGYVHVWSNPA